MPEAAFAPGELRVLVVDDEPDMRFGLRLLAESLGADVRTAASGEEAVTGMQGWTPHLVVSDITMPGMSGLDLLERLRRTHPAVRVILVTGFGTIEMAVQAMHGGAAHFVTKPFDNEDILAALTRFGGEALVDERVRALRVDADAAEPTLIARDGCMAPVLELVERVAPTRMTVLVQGESGVGKELVARAIHDRGPGRDRPFLAVNTAALPDALLESELFGYRKGAFTGADRDRQGLFEQAAGGTVFLDEIGLMSPSFQGKLLRVLQERTVLPLGTSRPVAVDFRLIAATSRSLKELLEAGTFRDDLYYRLQVVTIDVPPLRERPADIPALAAHFVSKYAGHVIALHAEPPRLTAAALDEMRRHPWPGNVRELENCIQRALVLARGGEIAPEHLGLREAGAAPAARDVSYEEGKQRAVQDFQRKYIEGALRREGGNVSRAARACGLTRAALQRIMRSLDLDRSRFSE